MFRSCCLDLGLIIGRFRVGMFTVVATPPGGLCAQDDLLLGTCIRGNDFIASTKRLLIGNKPELLW